MLVLHIGLGPVEKGSRPEAEAPVALAFLEF